MLRRNFLQFCSTLPFLGFLIPKIETKTRVFISFGEIITVVTDDESLLKLARNPLSITSHKAYSIVSDFVSNNREFNYLLNNGPKQGCLFYWEGDYSRKFRKELSELHGISAGEIGTALYLFEHHHCTKELS